MNLGDKILQLRKKNGLSQEQLGEKVDVTRQTISNWELGETTPNPEQLKKMSKAFNVSVDEILDNDSKEFLMNKISNTERLAGIIIKILKVIGLVFIGYIIFIKYDLPICFGPKERLFPHIVFFILGIELLGRVRLCRSPL